MLRWFGVLLLLPGVALAGQDTLPRRSPAARVVADPSSQCESAVASVELSARVPPRLLDAISVTETGRPDPATGRFRAWPFTINAEGQGQFFDTKEQAIAAVQALRARGVESIDVGCMQINLMYHPHAFANLQEAFDPWSNARYAASFLNTLYAESKDWTRAIAAYHSETPALGDAYRVLVQARWQNAVPVDPHPAAAAAYGDFAPASAAYGAFAPMSRAYGAFAPRN
jgi:hypothetical protein